MDHANHYNNLIESHYMHNIKVLYVPARCTGLTQPLDVGVFGPVKSSMCRKRDDYIRLNPSAPLYTEVNMLEWFYDSWHELHKTTRQCAFTKTVLRSVVSNVSSIKVLLRYMYISLCCTCLYVVWLYVCPVRSNSAARKT